MRIFLKQIVVISAGMENALSIPKVIVLVILRFCFSGYLHRALLHVSYVERHNE